MLHVLSVEPIGCNRSTHIDRSPPPGQKG